MKLDKNQIYTTEEVAEILKVAPITVKRYIAKNKIPSIKFNGLRRFKGEDLLKILKTKKYDRKMD
jgi:excisionase family DNA binding protein